MDGSSIKNFKNITAVKDDDVAMYYLKLGNGNVNTAVGRYFDNPKLYKKKDQPLYQKKKKKSGGKATMKDIFGNAKENKDKNEYYAGGAGDKGGSGTAILGGNKEEDYVTKLMNKAKEIQKGGGYKDEPKKVDKKKNTSVWDNLGGGSRLGFTGTDPVHALGNQPKHLKKKVPKKNVPKKKDLKLKLTFWKNGFTLGDSKLMNDKTNPKDKALLDSLHKGYVPLEYSQGAEMVSVVLEDRKVKKKIARKKKKGRRE